MQHKSIGTVGCWILCRRNDEWDADSFLNEQAQNSIQSQEQSSVQSPRQSEEPKQTSYKYMGGPGTPLTVVKVYIFGVCCGPIQTDDSTLLKI